MHKIRKEGWLEENKERMSDSKECRTAAAKGKAVSSQRGNPDPEGSLVEDSVKNEAGNLRLALIDKMWDSLLGMRERGGMYPNLCRTFVLEMES